MRNWINLVEGFGTTEKLYHGTNIDNLWLILKSGKLTADAHGRGYAGPTGVCLTRSFTVAVSFADAWSENLGESFWGYFGLGDRIDARLVGHVVLEFDRSLIKEKIIGYDDFGQGEGGDGDEQEERVIGDLSLDSLTGIYVNPKEVHEFLEAAVEAHKKGGSEYDVEFRSIINRVLQDPRLRNLADYGF